MKNNVFFMPCVIILAVLASGWISPILGQKCSAPGSPAQAEQQEDPYALHTVLVETFVVELTTEAVRKAGADIVGRDANGISITKLLWALRDEENGHVVSGLKLNAAQGRGEYSAQEEKTEYIKSIVTARGQDRVPVQVADFRPYETSKSLQVMGCDIRSLDNIILHYRYSESYLMESDEEAPPTVCEFSSNGVLTITPGQPVIADASQSEETVRFLVFLVTVRT